MHSAINRFGKHAVLLSLVSLFVTAAPKAHAWDDDYEHSVRIEHDSGFYSRGPECRSVVKKFKISRNVTVSERGQACRDPWGNWNMVTDTRYPTYTGEVYFNDRGGYIFVGMLYPQNNYYQDWPPRNHNHDNGPDFGWNDRPKCKKSHGKHHGHH